MGLGVVIDGKPYFGPDNTSGEFQTMGYNEKRINQFNMTTAEQAEYRNSPEIQKMVFTDLSDHLALFINFFNFKRIILGGDIPDLVPDMKQILQESIHRNWPYGNNLSCSIHIEREKDLITASGAAGMFLEQMFTVPELDHHRGALNWQKVFSHLDLPEI